MNLIRSLISILIVAIVVVSGYGIAWWSSPPAPLADSADGGRLILGLLMAASLLGLVRLWMPPKEKANSAH
ncbi:MAG: hypothetical protein R3F34_15890 [Planctomycetota bacterium]